MEENININSEYEVINTEESNNLLYSDEQLLKSNIDVILKKIETGPEYCRLKKAQQE